MLAMRKWEWEKGDLIGNFKLTLIHFAGGGGSQTRRFSTGLKGGLCHLFQNQKRT